jgi:O-acetylserine/cysteine efflux transporter
MSLRDVLLALLVAVIWGLNFIAIKWGVELVPPLFLTALRFLFAALPAVVCVRPPQVKLSLLMAYGASVGVLQFGALFLAIRLGMPAGLSSLVMQIQAFFTIGFAVLLLGERPGRQQVAGAAIASAGIAVIAAGRTAGAALLPLLLTLFAAAAWGFGNVVAKRAGRIDMFAFVVWSSLVPPLPMLAASLLTEGAAADWAALAQAGWLLVGVVAFLSYVSTLVGYGLWNALLSRYPAATVAPFSLLVPIVGIAAAALILGEPLSRLELAGSAVIFVGLLVNVWGARLRRLAGPA